MEEKVSRGRIVAVGWGTVGRDFRGKVLRVNLAPEKVERGGWSKGSAPDLLGRQGVRPNTPGPGVPPGANPLGPENMVVNAGRAAPELPWRGALVLQWRPSLP